MIYIVSQEVLFGVASLLDAMNVKYTIAPLRYGDFNITGRNGIMVIEKKKPGDFVGSLLSGHLADQLTRMSAEFDWSVLLVEGSINDALAEGHAPRKTIYSALLSALMKKSDKGKQGRVSVLMVESDWDTAIILERAQHWMDDPEGLIRSPYIGAPQVLGGNPQLQSLCAVANVGPVIGRELLKYFGTVGRIAVASKEELKSVANVGDVIADNIFRFYRTRYKETD